MLIISPIIGYVLILHKNKLDLKREGINSSE